MLQLHTTSGSVTKLTRNWQLSYKNKMIVLMTGSVIPGVRQLVRPGGVATYPDGTNHPLVKSRRTAVDPVLRYPDMNDETGSAHPFMRKLRALMGQKDGEHVYEQYPGVRMREGYQPLRENRDWRHQ